MLSIRKAQEEDCYAIYQIRIDEEIRKVSLNPEAFSYESHVPWFTQSLVNPHRKIYVIYEKPETIMAVVRFDLQEDEKNAVVSVFVSKNHWGKGIGNFSLQRGAELVKKEFTSLLHLQAFIKESNIASIKLFEKAGYYKSLDKYVFDY
jgi:UDP-2,4-diacetamido-2,4,6-trideoxy-beta-L-altropyranose hydrolase